MGERPVTVYGVLLAGGSGTRIGTAVPKQYVQIKGKPVIYYTLKNMLAVKGLHRLYIAVHADWVDYVQALAQQYFPEDLHRIVVTLGGQERQDSITNSIADICRSHEIGDTDIVLIHEAARPFADTQMLDRCVAGAVEHGSAVCSSPAHDTMFVSADGELIDSIPPRSHLFHGQTPDAYNLKQYVELESRIPAEMRSKLTGDAQVWVLNDVPIYMAPGSPDNFKITTMRDLKIAELFLGD